MRFPAGTRGLALGVFDASNFRAKAFFRLTSTPFTRLPLIATAVEGVLYLGVAGIPHTLELLGTSRFINDIAPMTTPSPMVTPF